MTSSAILRVGTCFATLVAFVGCSSSSPPNTSSGNGGSNSSGSGGSNSSGSGGSNNNTGGSNNNGSGGSNSNTGGSNNSGSGGSNSNSGGTIGSSGGSNGSGGNKGSGGTTASGGSNGSSGGSTGSSGGSTGSGSGGTSGNVDQGGVALAKSGDSTSTTSAYLNLGDMRLINNRWGSDGLNCSSTMQSVFVNPDKTIGWKFTRGNCGESNHDHPDFPEVEFGVAPFGMTSSLRNTPAFSSTKLLPIQISSLNSASVNIDTFNISFTNPTFWDANFEFWISKKDPTTNADAGVYAEIITFVGWENGRQSSGNGGWPCTTSGTVPNTQFQLCHQSDSWGSGWRFFNFTNGSATGSGTMNFSGKVDIKAILDYVKSKYSGFTNDMWLTRVEIGTEIDDNTAGQAGIKNLTFEINGTSKSIQLAN
jgi:hypothetical protein